ncbi:MAG: DNA helicase UvrD [Verrucomicrobia bacterium]|nr:DNA helicase UvrD [Verrucomicrobiota bacterium]
MLNLETLNAEQRDAVETIRGPVLILAGAGTGKTRVITFRIAHMIERGIAPDNILAVTFTNKAAREMQERVNALLPKLGTAHPVTRGDHEAKPARPTVSTFHSLCVRILRLHIEKLGYKRNFVIYDEAEQLGAIKKIIANISAKGEQTDPRAVLTLLSKFKNGGAQAEAAFKDPNVSALAEHVRKKYESALKACNAVDFDDLILLTLRLFSEHPDALDACRARFRYVMVDEYQDTNAAQFQLVHALTSKHRNLCVVGDDDQSIYGWRGAEVANLLDLEKHFPEVRVVKLQQNYRSTNTILQAANAVIKNNVQRRGKNLWSQNGQGRKILLQAFENEEVEARTIAETIEFQRMTQRVPWSDQAILFRTNLQSRPIEMELRKAGVRYHLIGGQSFFDRREVRDFLAYLKTFLNPHDDVSLLRIANVPARGLSDVTMERLLAASQERHCSVFAAMRHTDVQAGLPARTREALQAFILFVEETRAKLGDEAQATRPDALQQWAEKFLNDIGYWGELRRSEKNQESAESRVRSLRDLLATMDSAGTVRRTADALNQAEPTHGGGGPLGDRLGGFLENLTLDAEREEEREAGDAVTLITMHSCKGLEFPHVYVVGLEEGLLPHARSKVEGTLDEERRLFYVAITRAKRELMLSHCGARKKYGQLTPCHPSSFLKELPEHLIEDADEQGRQPVTQVSAREKFAALRAALE